MTLLRRVLGETLRGQRLRQRRTLREVSGAARVSLGYLSEVERGQKEASSELLASICDALDVRLSEVLREVSDTMRRTERAAGVARVPARQLVPAGAAGPGGGAGVPAELPVGRDGAEFGVGFDLPAGFDPAELVDRVGLEAARAGAPAGTRLDVTRSSLPGRDRLDADSFDPSRLDVDRFDPDRVDDAPDRIGPDRVGPERVGPERVGPERVGPERVGPERVGPERVGADRGGPDRGGPDRGGADRSGPDRGGLDGVDLADLETGDGFGDVDTLLSLTDLSCCLDRSDGSSACLAGTVAAA